MTQIHRSIPSRVFVMRYQMLKSRDSSDIHILWRFPAVCLLSILVIISIIYGTYYEILSSDFNYSMFGKNVTFLSKPGHMRTQAMDKIILDPIDRVENITICSNRRYYISNSEDYKFLTQKYVVVPSGPFDSLNIFMDSISHVSLYTAVIMLVLYLVFNSNTRKEWGVPEPWRIVVPSMFIFFALAVMTIVHSILERKYLKILCSLISEKLHSTTKLSCGDLYDIMRPNYQEHKGCHDYNTKMLKTMGTVLPISWTLLLCVLLLRFFFAVDFKMVDVIVTAYKPVSTKQEDVEKMDEQLERIKEMDSDEEDKSSTTATSDYLTAEKSDSPQAF